jgi:hypothetical protein
MVGVREALDTSEEWEQCRNCWYREGKYKSQRRAAEMQVDRFDIKQPTAFTTEAWNFEANDKTPIPPGEAPPKGQHLPIIIR